VSFSWSLTISNGHFATVVIAQTSQTVAGNIQRKPEERKFSGAMQ
jgi:hypothetical protein